MEVEEERRWEGEEEVVEEEEVVVGLERKRRDKGLPGKEEANGESLEIEEEEEEVDLDGVGEEERRSVYFDSEKGTEVSDIIGMESREDVQFGAKKEPTNGATDQFGAKKELTNGATESREEAQFDAKKDLRNGHASSEANELNTQDVIFVRDANRSLKNVIVENGSYAKTSSEGSSYSEITQNDDGVIVQKQITLLKSSKVILPDFDLERVLEEQDTHDLFCPNCNSCITKRVILRKRKRWVKDIQYGMPPKRIHEVDPIPALPLIEDQAPTREPPECFRCLSCLSFFFPTEGGGWNIFRLCGGKEEAQNQQSSAHISQRFKLWISSVFQPVPSHNQVSRQEPGDDPSLRGWQGPARTTVPGAETSNQNQIPIENSDAGTVLPTESPVPSNQREPVLEPIIEFEAQPSQTSTRGEKQDNLKINAGTVLPTESPVPSKQREPLLEPTIEFEAQPSQTSTMGEKQDNLKINGGTVLPTQSSVPSKQREPVLEPCIEFEAQPSQTRTRGEEQDNLKINADFQPPDGFNISSEPGKEPAQIKLPIIDIVRRSPGEAVAGDGIIVLGQVSGDVITPLPELLEPHSLVRIPESEPITVQPKREPFEWDILKAIVYGGLVESIASLSVVSSAAASGASTVNILVLAVANLISGLLLIVHNIFELKKEHDEATDRLIQHDFARYRDLLGKRPHFVRHLIVAVLSYIIVGTLPPLVYGFSFRKSSNTEYKLIAVAAASLLCVALLAIGKAHIRLPRKYIATMLYYLSLGITASGLSYVAGVMFKSLIEQLGLFNDHTSPAPPPPSLFGDLSSGKPAWASY